MQPLVGGRERFERRKLAKQGIKNAKVEMDSAKRRYRQRLWTEELYGGQKQIVDEFEAASEITKPPENLEKKMALGPEFHDLEGKLEGLYFDDETALGSNIGDHTNWLGSPSFKLPGRAGGVETVNQTATYSPPWTLVVVRLIIEFFRICLPTAVFIFFLIVFMADLTWLSDLGNANEGAMLLIWSCVYIGLGIAVAYVVVFMKWLFMGRFLALETPLYSANVWFGELIIALCESLVDPFFVNFLRGTPLITVYFRMMGVEIGSFAFISSCQMTEFDLISIGDEAMIGQDAILQTHLFEDRVMKTSQVQIGNFVSLGDLCVVLYDSKLEDGAVVSSLSLIMKGETIPSFSHWHGTPAKHEVDTDLISAFRKFCM